VDLPVDIAWNGRMTYDRKFQFDGDAFGRMKGTVPA